MLARQINRLLLMCFTAYCFGSLGFEHACTVANSPDVVYGDRGVVTRVVSLSCAPTDLHQDGVEDHSRLSSYLSISHTPRQGPPQLNTTEYRVRDLTTNHPPYSLFSSLVSARRLLFTPTNVEIQQMKQERRSHGGSS